MKKSMLLSFVTAGAIIATSVGTYAVWDQTSVSNGTLYEVTIDKAVTMEIDNTNVQFASTRPTGELLTTDGTVPEQTANINVNVKDVPDTAKDKYTLETSAELFQDDGTTPVNNTEATVVATPTVSTLNGGVTDAHEVTIKVTPADTTAAGKSYKVKVTASIVPVTPAE